MEAMGINGGFLIAQIINFVIIFGLLGAMIWKPLINVLEERREKIAKGLEDARVAAEARQNAEVEADKIKAEARGEAQKILADARARAEEVAKEVQQQAEADANDYRADARAKAEDDRNAMLADMRGQVASLAIAAANKLIGESMDEKKQTALVNNFFASAPEGIKGMSDQLVVTSALPLSDAEKEKVLDATGADEGDFKVDPAILGGLIIRAGDKVVDGSVRSSLGALSGRLN